MRITKLTSDQFINGRQRVKGEIVGGTHEGQVLKQDINKENETKTALLKEQYANKTQQDKLPTKV